MGDNYLPQNSKETSFVEDSQLQESNKKTWIFLGISIAVVMVVLFIVLFMELASRTISDDELSQGNFLNLEEDKEVKFKIGEEKHKIKVDSVYNDSVDIIIQSEIITANIKLGETKEFDLDGDGVSDIQVRLESIEEGVPYIFIKKISEAVEISNAICTENWVCTDWGICINKTKRRVCDDLNNCGTTKNKPEDVQECEDEMENESIVLTCSGQNGIICNQTEICNGTLINSLDSNKCCIGGCVLEIQEMIDCGTDFDCIIDASENCDLANFTNISTANLFGIIATTITYRELKGMESNKCVLYVRLEKNDLRYSDELIQQLLESNLTQEEIDEQEQTGKEQAHLAEGKDGICKVDSSIIKNYFSKWKDGTRLLGVSCQTNLFEGETTCIYSEDIEFFNECEGDYFYEGFVN